MREAAEVKSKAQVWRLLLAEQVQSGKSIHAFCVDHQIQKYTFYYWKKKYRDLPDKSLVMARVPGRFIPIPGKFPISSKSPRIHLPNGVQIELGAGLESGVVDQFLRSLCGVGHPPKDVSPAVGRHHAKP